MDERRFDGLAKSVAAWSSRRRFLGSVSGAAAGAAFIKLNSASAQTGVDLSGTCGDDAPNVLGDIQNLSIPLANDLKGLTIDSSDNVNGPQFAELLQQVKCVLEQGRFATDERWTPAQARLFLNQAQGLVSAMSVGYTGSWFSEAQSAERAGSLHALQAVNKSLICGNGGCIADALDEELVCVHGCHASENDQTNTCSYKCFVTFSRRLFLGLAATDATPATEPTSAIVACLPALAAICTGDCCLSNCISKGP